MAEAFQQGQDEGEPEGPIDCAHLARQTFGDPELQAEILAMFVPQSRSLCART